MRRRYGGVMCGAGSGAQAKCNNVTTIRIGPCGERKGCIPCRHSLIVSSMDFDLVLISSVGIALAGLIGWMIKSLADLHRTIADLQGQIGDLRGEVRGEISELRAEVRGEIASIRVDISDLRAEVYKELSEINARLGRIEGHLFGADFPAVAR